MNYPAASCEESLDSNTSGITEEYIAVPRGEGEHLFAVRVRDDSMQPRLQNGDILVIDPQVPFEGGIAVVRREEGYMIRTVRKFGDRWILVPLNEIYGITEIISGAEASFYVPIKLVCVRDFPNE